MKETVVMSVRLPEEVVTWLRRRAAEETIERNKRVSMNGLIVEILAKAMRTERGEG